MNRLQFPLMMAVFTGLMMFAVFMEVKSCQARKERRQAEQQLAIQESKEAYLEGERAGRADLPVLANPYEGWSYSEEWKKGWASGQLEIKNVK